MTLSFLQNDYRWEMNQKMIDVEASQFITPTTKLAKWISSLARDLPIIEVGTGTGKLLHLLAKVHSKVIGCDPYFMPMEHYSGFMPLPADQVKFIRNMPSLIVATRPDHSGWVGEIPDYMNDDSKLLYIGLSDNIDRDFPNLCKLPYRFVELPKNENADVAILIKHKSKLP